MKYCKQIAVLGISIMLSGCFGYGTQDDDVTVDPAGPQQYYTPVTMNREAFEASVALQPPTPMEKSGKIYIKDHLLFVGDVNKGFHIYSYDAQGQPQETAFIKAPGATDVAMRGTTLYINQATDLVTLVYDNNQLYFVKRNRNVFPQKESPDGSWANIAEDEIIIDWAEAIP